MDVVEFNASDTRSKKLMNAEVTELLSNRTLQPFFSSKWIQSRRYSSMFHTGQQFDFFFLFTLSLAGLQVALCFLLS